jgi:predicted nucleic acid-binding protein
MASPLADFQGEAIYVDTNVLVGLVDASSVYHPACAPFCQRAGAPARPIQLFMATLTLDEVVFVLLQELDELTERHLPLCRQAHEEGGHLLI